MLLMSLKKQWNASPQFRRTIVALGILVIGAMSFIFYMTPYGKSMRVGYKNPKIAMEYSAKASSDTPVLNRKGLRGAVGDVEGCHKHTPLGSPNVAKAGLAPSIMVCHDTYATVFNSETKTPVFVSHVLNRTDFLKGKYVERESQFIDDPILNGGKEFPTSDDYKGTGYDRGHLMPAGDATHDEFAMKETFYMTNIAPQAPAHNRGIWARLEKDIRELLKRGKVCVPTDQETFETLPKEEKCQGTKLHPYQTTVEFEQLYITTGVLYHVSNKKDIPQIGNPEDGSMGTFKSGIKIPNYFYKIIFEPRTGMSAAYLIPNVPQVGNEDYHKFHIPLKDLEKKYTYMEFFPEISRKEMNKFKNFYITKTDKGEIKFSGGRNGMLDRFLF